MVLTPEGAGILRDLSWQLQSTRAIVAMPRHPLTVVDESTGWLDLSLRFLEPWVYPMGPDFTFVKAFDWELREFPPGVERIVLQQGLCVEVKWLDADEYAHWRRDGVDFTNTRLYRKLREFEVDEAIRNGDPEALGGLVRVTAPEGVHIIDHVSRDWLWRQPRPLVQHSLPASLKHRDLATGARTTVTHPLHDLRLPGPTLVLVDDSDSLALDALHGIEDLPGIEPTVVPLSTLDGPPQGLGLGARRGRRPRPAAADGQRRTPPRPVQGRRLLAHRRAHPVGARAAPGVAATRPPRRPRGRDRGVLTVARFASGARAQLVVMEMARQAAGPGDTTHGGLVVAYAGRPPPRASTPGRVLLPDVAGAGDAERDVPPDVVVARRGRRGRRGAPRHRPRADRRHRPRSRARRRAGLQPDRLPQGLGPARRRPRPAGHRFGSRPGHRGRRRRGPRLPGRAPAGRHAAPPTCSRWRSPGCRWSPRACSTSAPPLAAALDATVDLDDPLRREEHSLAVRRAAFDHHSTLAWRSALAVARRRAPRRAAAGQRPAGDQAARDARLRAAPGRPPARRRRRAGAGRPRLRARPRRRTPCARRPAAPGARPSTSPTFFGDVLTDAARAASERRAAQGRRRRLVLARRRRTTC